VVFLLNWHRFRR